MNLRKWASQFFSSNEGITSDMYTPLKLVRGHKGDFDTVAKIVKIHEMDTYTNELKIRDQTGSTWYVLALRLKFPHLKTGQVIKIRSATWDESSCSTGKQVMTLCHYSNILTFIEASSLATNVSRSVQDDQVTDLL